LCLHRTCTATRAYRSSLYKSVLNTTASTDVGFFFETVKFADTRFPATNAVTVPLTPGAVVASMLRCRELTKSEDVVA
jgi:hypothetical protein